MSDPTPPMPTDDYAKGCERLAAMLWEYDDWSKEPELLATDQGLKALWEFVAYIASSPPKEYGGFNQAAVDAAVAALRTWETGKP